MTEYACPRRELSCIVGNLFVELEPPCDHCAAGDSLTICGNDIRRDTGNADHHRIGFTFDGPRRKSEQNPGKAVSEIDQRQTEQKPTQEFAIITKAKDLVKHTFMMTSERRFPKKYRFTIVNRLHDLTLDIFQHIQEANELDLTDPQEYRERRYEQKRR